MRSYPALTLSVLTTLLSVTAFAACAAAGWPFPPLDEAEFGCEQQRGKGNAWFAQPASSASSIAYIIAGMLIAASTDTNNPKRYWMNSNALVQFRALPTLLACTLCLLGPGSASLHASLTVVGQQVDLVCMFLVGAAVFVYVVFRLLRLHQVHLFFMLYTAIVSVFVFWIFFTQDQAKEKVMTMMSLLMVSVPLEMYIRVSRRLTTSVSWRWFLTSVLSMVLAILLWRLSASGNVLCLPDSFLQGHAFWHVGSALSIGFMFLYTLSENEKEKGTNFNDVSLEMASTISEINESYGENFNDASIQGPDTTDCDGDTGNAVSAEEKESV